jgi:hypothetical protein
MRRIDKLIAPALEAFDYQPISSTGTHPAEHMKECGGNHGMPSLIC